MKASWTSGARVRGPCPAPLPCISASRPPLHGTVTTCCVILSPPSDYKLGADREPGCLLSPLHPQGVHNSACYSKKKKLFVETNEFLGTK